MMVGMSRTNIDVDEKLIREARKLTRLKTKREIVHRALELQSTKRIDTTLALSGIFSGARRVHEWLGQ